MQHKGSFNKIFVVGSDSEKIAYHLFKDLLPNITHLLCDMVMRENIKEKSLKLGFTKSEVAAVIEDSFSTQIEDTVEEGLADSLAAEKFTATMIAVEQKWKNNGEKGEQFYHYLKVEKLYQTKSCMSAEVRAVVGLRSPPKTYLQNANKCMNSVLKPAGLAKCKSIDDVADKFRIVVNYKAADIYLLKINNRNTRCEICLKLTIKTPERRHWRRLGIFIVNFEHISHLVLVFLLLTLNM